LIHVAICIPSCGTYESGMALALARLCVYSARAGININLCGYETASIALNRNTIVERVLAEGGSDYLLWIDSDVTFPPDGLIRLLAHDEPVVGADYPRRKPPHDFTGRPLEHGSQPQSGFVEFEFIPAGFMLVWRQVYDSFGLKSPWYYETYAGMNDEVQGAGEDINFCRDLRHLGIKIWCDLDLTREMGHIGRLTFSAGKE
jgi:glycosyltransferase involved in cell wall biosynthesis